SWHRSWSSTWAFGFLFLIPGGLAKRQRAGRIGDEWKACEPPRHAPPGGSFKSAPYRVDLGRIARPARAKHLARGEHHHHLPAFEPRLRLHLSNGRGVGLDAVEQLRAELLMRHLAASEAQGDFHLVALLEEAADRAHLHVVIVCVDVRPHLDLLDLDGALLLARFGGLLLRLVFVFAVVEDLADRGL